MTISDLTIPRLSDILDRACEALASAYRLQDDPTARQLERTIRNLPAAKLRWQLGTLILTSPSGSTYHVTRAGCDCPNGTKSHARACWHVATFELLTDMLDTEAQTRDQAADPPGENPLGDSEGDPEPPDRPRSPWYARATTVRSVVWAVNWNS